MNGYRFTRIWQIDHKLVVANTVEDAIALFRIYRDKDYCGSIEPEIIKAISINSCITDYDAIIKEEKD